MDTHSLPESLSGLTKLIDTDTLLYIARQGDAWGKKLHHIYFDCIQKNDYSEVEISEAIKKKFYYSNERLAYARLMLFEWERFDPLTLAHGSVVSMSNYIIAHPWMAQSLDYEEFNGLSYNTLKECMNIVKRYGDDCGILEFIRKMKKTRSVLRAVDLCRKFNDLAAVHEKLKAEGKFDDVKVRGREECKFLKRYISSIVLDIYTTGDDSDQILARAMTCDDPKGEKVKLKNAEKNYRIFDLQIPWDTLHNIAKNLGRAYLDHLHGIKPTKKPKYTVDQDTLIHLIKTRGWSKTHILNAVNRVGDMLDEDPSSLNIYYRNVYPSSQLVEDVAVVQLAHPDLYKRYKAKKEEIIKKVQGPKAGEYKAFAKLLTQNARVSPERTYTNSTLYDLVTMINDFDREEFSMMVDAVTDLSSKERAILRTFYKDKVMQQDCIKISSEEELINSGVLIIRKRVITEDARRAVIKYMKENNYPLYRGVFWAMIRAWIDGKFEIADFPVSKLEIYDKEIEPENRLPKYLKDMERRADKCNKSLFDEIISSNTTEILSHESYDESIRMY